MSRPGKLIAPQVFPRVTIFNANQSIKYGGIKFMIMILHFPKLVSLANDDFKASFNNLLLRST